MVENFTPIRLESMPPLVLFERSDDDPQMYLKCPYEYYGSEAVIIDMLPDMPHTARVKLEPAGGSDSYDVERNLFISQTDEQKIVTMSAEGGFYTRGVEIDVFSWKDKSGKFDEKYHGDKEEASRIKIVRQVNAEFVSGYSNAVQIHRNRVADLKLNDITPYDGQAIYEAMLWTVPK